MEYGSTACTGVAFLNTGLLCPGIQTCFGVEPHGLLWFWVRERKPTAKGNFTHWGSSLQPGQGFVGWGNAPEDEVWWSLLVRDALPQVSQSMVWIDPSINDLVETKIKDTGSWHLPEADLWELRGSLRESHDTGRSHFPDFHSVSGGRQSPEDRNELHGNAHWGLRNIGPGLTVFIARSSLMNVLTKRITSHSLTV